MDITINERNSKENSEKILNRLVNVQGDEIVVYFHLAQDLKQE